MKIALYARVSTRDKGQDTENQLIQLRAFAEKQNWTIVGEYVDRKTGKNADREEFKKMFRAASQRKFELVLFWSLDRFSREGVLGTLQHLECLAQAGVGYRSYTEQYLDSCGVFKDAVLSILATIAKQERIRVSERVHAGLAKARAAGRVGGRPRSVVNRERVLELRESGFSLRQIASRMHIGTATAIRILRELEHAAPADPLTKWALKQYRQMERECLDAAGLSEL